MEFGLQNVCVKYLKHPRLRRLNVTLLLVSTTNAVSTM